MYTIENEKLKVTVNPLGAELTSLYNKVNNLEYMWSGDPAYWPKRSPVLFPIVGTLKENKYFYEGTEYELSRHGFAREKMFSVKTQSANTISFELLSDENTLKLFPFEFAFSIEYTIFGTELSVKYHVENTGVGDMYFSVGAHPAFRLPIEGGLAYEDYYLLFNKTELAGRWPISAEGLIENTPVVMLDGANQLQLSKEMFYKDAIVFKHLHSDELQLRSEKSGAGFNFRFSGFPYLGIWAAKDADFICIEPWCGIADSVDSNQQLTDKEGMINLKEGEVFERSWSIEV